MALVDEYYAAIRGGKTGEANYLAQMLASNAGININANQVTAMSPDMLQQKTAAPGDSFMDRLIGPNSSIGYLAQALSGNIPNATGQNQQGIGDAVGGFIGGVTGTVKSAKKAIDFITDIPRVATTLLGLIILIAGIFALARGNGITINPLDR